MTWNYLISFFEKAAVVVLMGYILFRTAPLRPFAEDRRPGWAPQLVLGVVFGLFAIYGTLSGIRLPGAVINIRDMGPLIAGLVGGPVPGVIAGVIGGVHRLAIGLAEWEMYGLTAVPCAVSTLLIGLIAGLIRNRRGLVHPASAVLIAALAEVGHNGLGVLLAGRPTEMFQLSTMRYAWTEVVRHSAPPMILVNALGLGVFFGVFRLFRGELRAFKERDSFYQEVEQRNTELRSVYEIAQAMSASSVNPDTALRTILTRVREMICYDEAAIYLHVAEDDTLHVQARAECGTIRTTSTERKVPLGSGLAGWVGQHRQSLLISDASAPADSHPTLTGVEGRASAASYIGIPLMLNDRLVGTLELTGRRSDMFDEHSLRLLETIAPQATIAIENAQLIREREEKLRRTIRELRIEIDEVKKARHVAEITKTEYFQSLRDQAEKIRRRSGTDGDTSAPK